MGTLHVSAGQYSSGQILLPITLLTLAVLSGRLEGARRETNEAVYCVVKPNADSSKLQDALDWTCGRGNSLGSVDCSAIQTGGSCFEPNTVVDHASYAFTLYYYHQNAASQACDFKGLATLTSNNPSSGTCVYPTSQTSASTSSSSPSDSGSLMAPPLGSSLPFPSSPAPSPSGAPATSSLRFSSARLLVCLLTSLLGALFLP